MKRIWLDFILCFYVYAEIIINLTKYKIQYTRTLFHCFTFFHFHFHTSDIRLWQKYYQKKKLIKYENLAQDSFKLMNCHWTIYWVIKTQKNFLKSWLFIASEFQFIWHISNNFGFGWNFFLFYFKNKIIINQETVTLQLEFIKLKI